LYFKITNKATATAVDLFDTFRDSKQLMSRQVNK